jgi:hypothetical protein
MDGTEAKDTVTITDGVAGRTGAVLAAIYSIVVAEFDVAHISST